MIRVHILAACAAALTAAPLHAETFPIGPVAVEIPVIAKLNACMAEANGNDLDMAACSAEEATAWDHRLNAAWARLRAALPQRDLTKLQVAQRGWLAYRDHECMPDPEAGTAARLAGSSCWLRLTAIRAAELEARALAR
jgi:uncharacterized protein YecT (DUF1311 family)